MEEHPYSPELQRIRKEQERERRRLRDRERRLSMTLDQREKHLARRRRSYRLRRLRAGNARIDTVSEQANIATGNEMALRTENRAENPLSELNGSDHGQEILSVDCTRSLGLEGVSHGSAGFRRRVRLSHIRRVARSINYTKSTLTEVITKGDTSSCCIQNGQQEDRAWSRLQKGPRLNCVKRLLRGGINSTAKECTS